jgi:hypothetical protein
MTQVLTQERPLAPPILDSIVSDPWRFGVDLGIRLMPPDMLNSRIGPL